MSFLHLSVTLKHVRTGSLSRVPICVDIRTHYRAPFEVIGLASNATRLTPDHDSVVHLKGYTTFGYSKFVYLPIQKE